jgi:hypothetical protein
MLPAVTRLSFEHVQALTHPPTSCAGSGKARGRARTRRSRSGEGDVGAGQAPGVRTPHVPVRFSTVMCEGARPLLQRGSCDWPLDVERMETRFVPDGC